MSVTRCGSRFRDAERGFFVGAELEKLRVEYHDEIEAMRALCLKVEESQERVRLETEHLRENEKAVKIQENKILASSEQIELKQAEFQAKGECAPFVFLSLPY